jgi:hypothetical protein
MQHLAGEVDVAAPNAAISSLQPAGQVVLVAPLQDGKSDDGKLKHFPILPLQYA